MENKTLLQKAELVRQAINDDVYISQPSIGKAESQPNPFSDKIVLINEIVEGIQALLRDIAALEWELEKFKWWHFWAYKPLYELIVQYIRVFKEILTNGDAQ